MVPGSGGRRRGRRRLLRAALVLLVAVPGWFAYSAFNYVPALGFHGGITNYQGPERREISAPGVDAGYVFRYHAGEAFSVGFTLTNRGSRRIEVVGFGDRSIPYFLSIGVWTGTGEDSSERQGGYPRAALIEFRPFSLGRGENRYVELRYRFARCDLPALPPPGPSGFMGGISWTTQLVRYRHFGRTRDLWFDLPSPVGLEGVFGECPAPPS